MSESKTIARPYARACFNVAQETGNTDDWLLFLEAAAEVVKDEAMLNLVKSPGIDKQELAKTIVAISNEASGASDLDERRNFILLLSQNNRLEALTEIKKQFQQMKQELQRLLPKEELRVCILADEVSKRNTKNRHSKVSPSTLSSLCKHLVANNSSYSIPICHE